MDSVLDWVSAYGYVAIYVLLMLGIVGLPVPDETLLVFSGYLISKGRLNPVGAFLAALAGSVSGITVSYTLGRTLGLGVVHKYGRYLHVTEERLQKVHDWFHRVGHWALFIGYYIAGVRHFTAVVAGTSRLELKWFAAYAWSGALVWVSTFLTLGYFLGENWSRIAEIVHRDVGYVSLAVIAIALVYWLVRRRVRANRDRPKVPG